MKSNEIQNSKTTEKIYQTKSLFFAINKLGKSLARLIREEKKRQDILPVSGMRQVT